MIKCDVCKKNYSIIIDLGKQFLANHYEKNYHYKAKVAFCINCKILKNIHKIPNSRIFQKNYPYLSSLSVEFKRYLKKISQDLKKKISKGNILEIGSNDGSFLENFQRKLYNPIGLEPAFSSHIIAKKKITSINRYFNKKNALILKKKYQSFDLIFSINTFAHIDNIQETFKLVGLLLNKQNKKSVFVFENIDITSLVKKNNFSQLYDEHVYTLSATCVNNICKKNNLVLFDIKKTNNQDGSFRYYIGHGKIKQKNSVKTIIKKEKNSLKIFLIKKFNKNILEIKKNTKKFFLNSSTPIFGFGASAKATFIANFLSLNKNNIKYIFDNSPYKINKNLPGTNIKIIEETLINNIKECILFIFIPNHLNEIIKKYHQLSKKNKIIFKTINDI